MADIFLLLGIVLVLLFFGYLIKICFYEIDQGFSSFVDIINSKYTTKR